jgi:hypothetical protein
MAGRLPLRAHGFRFLCAEKERKGRQFYGLESSSIAMPAAWMSSLLW